MMADITEEVGLVASHGRPRSIDPETATDGPIGWCLVALSAIRLENSRVSLYRGLASLRTKRTPDVLASEAFRMQCQQMSVVEPVAPTRDVTTLDNKLFTVFVSSILDLSSVPLSPHTHRMLQQAARWSGWSPYFDFLKLITGEAAKQRALCSRCNRMPLHSSLLDTSDWDHLPSFADLFGRLPLSCERCRLGLAQNLASDKEFQDACANLSSPLSKQCMFARLCGLSCITALVYTDVAFRAVFRDPVLLCRLRELHERISSAESSYYKDILLPPLRRTLDCLTDERVLSILSETSGSSASADGISAETSLLRHLKDPDTLLLAAFRMHFYRHPSRDIRSPSAAAAAAPAPEKTGSSSSFQTLEVFLQKNRMDPLASTVIWSFMDLHYGYHAEWNRPWL
ncbi:hypothetical protein PUNSTDRAFT_144080 [Punctularia strigosozonata HHB-11173 SS5]|uniref:uncharacterized protein n=1 Tax=Punctularia strigosozonata (strain HHB-11173) TaxID=741275 RepID=UPI00044174E1|nr:uncharacterized protein PUNSTDRAFT_144080 [Punctularia strigosozonata HHB-11173 SS5]EIN08518.1 hypothetical protein PUNSTDRAFT_144080 [Punctularia strigosozonata HHB-11173 SS5]